MKFNTDEIASVLREEIDRYESSIDVREVGRVLEVGDGIARVWGLSGVMAGEMVEFPGGIIGLAFNLEENSVGVIILGDYLKVTEGDEVRSTGRLLSVPKSARRSRPGGHHSATPRRGVGSWCCTAFTRSRASSNGHQSNRCNDTHRTRTTRTHYWRS